MLYEITCKGCESQWVSGEDDAIHCDPCVIAGNTDKERVEK